MSDNRAITAITASIGVEVLTPIPTSEDPWRYNPELGGTRLASNIIVMFDDPDDDTTAVNDIIVINTNTGERVQLHFS